MVPSAERGDVVTGRRSTGVVGLDVVAVATSGVAGAPREDTRRVDQSGLFTDPVGDLVGVHVVVVIQVDDRLDDDLGVGVAAPVPDLLDGDRGSGCSRTAPARRPHHGSRPRRDGHGARPAAASARVRGALVVGAVEVEGQLPSGDRPEGLGAAYVQRLGRPECLQRLGTLGNSGVEVEGISHIEGAPDLGVPVETGAGLPDVERPTVRGGLAAPLGLLGHELGDRGLDQPVELTDAEPVRKRRDPGVHERRGLHRERQGGLGDPPRLPRHQVTTSDALPDPRESVAQLDRLTQVRLARPRSTARPRPRTQ